VGAPDAPKRHGQPVQLLVLASPEAVAGVPGAEPARTAGGHVLTQGALDRLSCSSPMARCLLSGSVPLDLGRTVRIATEAQYRALVVRDGGCAVRGCDRPASWCSPHHVIPWQHGGSTDLSNLVLLCEAHHHALHDREHHLPLRDGRVLTATGALAGTGPPGG
jgi:5-methylcytosine-specific restriction protein A